MDNIIQLDKLTKNKNNHFVYSSRGFKEGRNDHIKFDPEDPAYEYRKMGIKNIPEKENFTKRDKTFFDNLKLIKEYMKENNTRQIPVKLIYKGKKLGSYISKSLRDRYKKGKLEQYRIDILEVENFIWDDHEYRFTIKVKSNYDIIKKCKEKNTEIPKDVLKFFSDIKCYSKVKGTRFYIRYLHISEYIDLDTCEILKEIDFDKLERDLYNRPLSIKKSIA